MPAGAADHRSDTPGPLKICDPWFRFSPSSYPPRSKGRNPRIWAGLVWSKDCVGRVLPSSEVHRPNTTALDQRQSCFRSPGPQGAQLGGGYVSNSSSHGRQPETGDQSASGALPHPDISSGGCGRPLPSAPAPPATPLPLSFLPTRLDFSKTKCDTAHHPQTLQPTSLAGGKQPFLPCGSWAEGQRQENSSTNRHIITATSPRAAAMPLQKRSPHPGSGQQSSVVGQGTLGSLNPGQVSGNLRN